MILVPILLLMAISSVCSHPMLGFAAQYGHDNQRQVQIRVFRGPTDPHTQFAPWGYYIQQPEDYD